MVFSYRQTVRAYPNGGGAYIVSKDNLGTLPGLVAAAALLTDYVLTVSVSVVAGVFAITSAVPGLHPHKVELSMGSSRSSPWRTCAASGSPARCSPSPRTGSSCPSSSW